MLKATLTILFFVVLLASCRKKTGTTTDPNDVLSFSQSEIVFDTVFTTVGSTVRKFTVRNENQQKIVIASIDLENGSNSPFRINVNGVAGVHFENIEILPLDSIFIFAEVTLDPNSGTLPMVVEEKILFNTNTIGQEVKLVAWGQDAYFHNNEVVSGTWNNDKPHVIYNTAAVGFPGIDSNLVLSIPAGTQIYMHNNAQLLVYKSQLLMNGTFNEPITMQGDRREAYYDGVSGQYRGIYLIQSEQSLIQHCLIKNANVGIQVDTVKTAGIPAVRINNTQVQNSFSAGIYAVAGAHIVAENSTFVNADRYTAYFFAGGQYEFKHCTFANTKGSPNEASNKFQNYFDVDGVRYVRPITNSFFYNCIFWGSNLNEINWDIENSLAPNLIFGHCAFTAENNLAIPQEQNSFYNLNPLFESINGSDVHLKTGSAMINIGDPSNSLLNDKDEVSRDATPDLGAYEFQ